MVESWYGGISSFFFGYNVKAHMRANTQRTNNKGSRRQEGWEREGKNSWEQRHEDICGRERDVVGYTGKPIWTRQGLSGPYTAGTFRKESREFEGDGFGVDFTGVEKIVVLDGGR